MAHKGKICQGCGKAIYDDNVTGYCKNCLTKVNRQETIVKWLETGDTGCGVATTLRNAIRDYLYEQQDHCCAICGMPNEWEGKPLTFILDHIDGDASHNNRENLRLICPNCDSQLPTYKSKNKNSARTHRRT